MASEFSYWNNKKFSHVLEITSWSPSRATKRSWFEHFKKRKNWWCNHIFYVFFFFFSWRNFLIVPDRTQVESSSYTGLRSWKSLGDSGQVPEAKRCRELNTVQLVCACKLSSMVIQWLPNPVWDFGNLSIPIDGTAGVEQKYQQATRVQL